MDYKLVKYNSPIFDIVSDFFSNDSRRLSPADAILDKLMAEMFPQVTSTFGTKLFENSAYPRVDIRETDTQFILEAEVPGLTKDQIQVEVKDDTLTIKGKKREDNKKEGKYNLREIKRSSFVRSFVLPTDVVDKKSIEAKFQNGTLEITMNKLKPTPPPAPESTTIEIK